MFRKFSLAVLLSFSGLHACSDFTLVSEDNSIVNGRTMEFNINLHSQLSVHPKGEFFQSDAPENQKGISWTSKYGYASIIAFGLERPVDGINEKGLTFAALWLPNAVYPTTAEPSLALDLEYFGAWILGNFATVEELKEGLSKIQVWSHVNDTLGIIPTLHFAVHDALGQSLVIEFVNGKAELSDNPVGVLTNAPTFHWHLNNLKNYISLEPKNPDPIKSGNYTISNPSNGGGMLGIPGDWSPPSRFVKLFYMKHFANKPKNTQEAITLAGHLLNTMDIPAGIVNGPDGEFSQWTIIKDITNKKLRYRTYSDQNWRDFDLMSNLSQPLKKPL